MGQGGGVGIHRISPTYLECSHATAANLLLRLLLLLPLTTASACLLVLLFLLLFLLQFLLLLLLPFLPLLLLIRPLLLLLVSLLLLLLLNHLGDIPIDVNTALVPAGLRATSELADAGYINASLAAVAQQQAAVWEEQALPLFRVDIPAQQVGRSCVLRGWPG